MLGQPTLYTVLKQRRGENQLGKLRWVNSLGTKNKEKKGDVWGQHSPVLAGCQGVDGEAGAIHAADCVENRNKPVGDTLQQL